MKQLWRWEDKVSGLSALFTAESEKMEELLAFQGSLIFDEPWGKHTEYIYKINKDDFTLISEDPEKIKEYQDLGISDRNINPYWMFLDEMFAME